MTGINWKRGLFRLKLLWSLAFLPILLTSFALNYSEHVLYVKGWRQELSGGWVYRPLDDFGQSTRRKYIYPLVNAFSSSSWPLHLGSFTPFWHG